MWKRISFVTAREKSTVTNEIHFTFWIVRSFLPADSSLSTIQVLYVPVNVSFYVLDFSFTRLIVEDMESPSPSIYPPSRAR